MSPSPLIVVSGLPASGKTTIGTALGERLRLPVLDKDEILEALFDGLGCEDRDRRYRLSRASDEILYRMAGSVGAAVLVNWWSHDSAPARLHALGRPVVEVHCDCPVDVAAARFRTRRRHPGHLDRLVGPEEHEERTRRLRDTYPGPLRVGDHLVRVDTSGPVDVEAVVRRLQHVMEPADR